MSPGPIATYLVVDDNNVYFTSGNQFAPASTDGVYGVAKGGGTPYLIATPGATAGLEPAHPVLSNGVLYWDLGEGYFESAPITARNATPMLLDQIVGGGGAALDGSAVFGPNLYVANGCSSIISVPIAGGKDQETYSDSCSPDPNEYGFAVDTINGYGYLLDRNVVMKQIHLADGAFHQYPIPAGFPDALAIHQATVYALITNAQETGDSLFSMTADGTVTPITDLQQTSDGKLIVDGTAAYYVVDGGTLNTSFVYRLPLATLQSAPVFSSGTRPSAIAVDDQYLYVADGAQITRVAK